MQGWFEFVQTEDGSIPVTRYSREEDPEVINIKKAIVSAFQANFKGTKVKEEADPQSYHKAEYTYAFSLYLSLIIDIYRPKLFWACGPRNTQLIN